MRNLQSSDHDGELVSSRLRLLAAELGYAAEANPVLAVGMSW